MIAIRKQYLLLFFLYILTISLVYSQTPAFPTAEGYGMWVTGGRGGKVVEITTTENQDARGKIIEGGLSWALDQYPGEPITIVFKVSGVIDLKGNDLRKKRSNLTIAGQTAPGDGICIKGGNVNLGGSFNVIIRHVRFRVGLKDNGTFIEGGAIGLENGGNFIIDHCTFGWSGEENMTIYDDYSFTVQWCILHEGLYDVGHPKGARSYGSQWGGETATYHHNLLANNVSRTPRINGAKSNDINVLMDYVNNVNFNWGKQNSTYGGEMQDVGQTQHCNWINNYYKPGPARDGSHYSYFIQAIGSTTERTSLWYLAGNFIEGAANEINNTDNYEGIDLSVYTDKGIEKSTLFSPTAFEVPYTLKIESVEDAYNSVLAKAGAFPRDSVDLRIIKEVETGNVSGSGKFGEGKGIIDDPEVVGGFPNYQIYHIVADVDHDGMADYWELANGLDTTDVDDRNKTTSQGYTYLEAYLNGLVGEELDELSYPLPIYIDNTSTEILGINEVSTLINDGKFLVYVDSTDRFLKTKSAIAIEEMVIYDIHGTTITRFSSPDVNDIDLSELPSGLFILRALLKNGEVHTAKFIIN